jgi:hypothetical protein
MEFEGEGKLFESIARRWPALDQRQRRLLAAEEAKRYGHGGVTLLCHLCGLSRVTITKGIREIAAGASSYDEAGRRYGSGRPTIVSLDPSIEPDLRILLEDTGENNPQRFIFWTFRGVRSLSEALRMMGHSISHVQVARMMHALGYSMRMNQNIEDRERNKDFEERFLVITWTCEKAYGSGQPVISVETRRKRGGPGQKDQDGDSLGTGAIGGAKQPELPDLLPPKAGPNGVYGVLADEIQADGAKPDDAKADDAKADDGYVNIETDLDAPAFTVASIRGWWEREGKRFYPDIEYLVVTLDYDESKGHRPRLWKVELQKLARHIGAPVKVRHFPQGAVRWNKSRRTLFTFLSSNWNIGSTYEWETVVSLISDSYDKEGLAVKCRLDHSRFKFSDKITQAEIDALNLSPDKLHGEWNYTLLP